VENAVGDELAHHQSDVVAERWGDLARRKALEGASRGPRRILAALKLEAPCLSAASGRPGAIPNEVDDNATSGSAHD
jgi:hypothetical protein